jgi:hypothetical protein
MSDPQNIADEALRHQVQAILQMAHSIANASQALLKMMTPAEAAPEGKQPPRTYGDTQ